MEQQNPNQFSQYESMENHYNILDKFRDPTHKLYTNELFQWVATEKIHGTNFSFVTDGNNIQCCKRTSMLVSTESFFDYQTTANACYSDVIKIFKYLKDHNNEIIQIQIYGELFGGQYNNKPTKNVSMIQNGMNYHPEHKFMFYDIKLTTHDTETETETDTNSRISYLDFETIIHMMEILDLAEIKLVPVLSIGNIETIAKLDPIFKTQVPKVYGLEEMENNYAEGFVIHPLIERNINSTRTIFKFKNPAFTEFVGFGIKKAKEMKPGGIIKSHLTLHRYDNVISKMSQHELTEENIINNLANDVKQDLSSFADIEFDDNMIKSYTTGFVKKIAKENESKCNTTINLTQSNGIDLLTFLNMLKPCEEQIQEIKKFRMEKDDMSNRIVPSNAIDMFSVDEKNKYDIYINKPHTCLMNMIKYLISKQNQKPDETNIYELLFDGKIKLWRISKEKKIKVCRCKVHSTDLCVCGLESFVAQTEHVNYTSCGQWKKSFYFHVPTDLFNYIVGNNQYKSKYEFVEIPSQYFKLYLDFDFKNIPSLSNDKQDEIVLETWKILCNIIICNEPNSTPNAFKYIYSDKKTTAIEHEQINEYKLKGVHLYFPNLITDVQSLKKLLSYIKNELCVKFSVECAKIFDDRALGGLKLLFQGDYYYDVNPTKSTIELEPNLTNYDKLVMTRLRTDLRTGNFSLAF